MIAGILSYLPIALKCIVITCIIELIIAVIFKIYNYKVILAVNVATQLLLHIVMVNIFYIFRPIYRYGNQIFTVTELVIFVLEYLLYCKFIKDKKKYILLGYVLTANFATYFIGLLFDI